MERITHDTIKITIEKPRHTKVTVRNKQTTINVLKGTLGTPGREGDVYVPRTENGYLIWEKTEYDDSPERINLGSIAQSISNSEILSILNS